MSAPPLKGADSLILADVVFYGPFHAGNTTNKGLDRIGLLNPTS